MHVRRIPSTEGVAINCDYASLAQNRFLLQKDCCWVGVSPFSDTTFMLERCNTDTQSTEARSRDVSPSVPDIKQPLKIDLQPF